MSPPARKLDLPPRFRPVALRELGDAFDYATAQAAALGAGALVFVGRFDVAEFAVVLEPEEPLTVARRAFYAGMLALAETLAALAPPETSIGIAWPDAVHVGGRPVGGGCFAWPDGGDEDAVPDWLVFGAAIRLVSRSGKETGRATLSALKDEGFGEIGVERFIEGLARHLMAAFDRWRDGGLAALLRDFSAMLRREPGACLAIDANGDLRIERPGEPAARRDLRAVLASPSWLGVAREVPRG
jgi:biotin-(acetyl-CoA carboxylase) ligase